METPIPNYTDYPTPIINNVEILIEELKELIKDSNLDPKLVSDRIGEVLFENWSTNKKDIITPDQLSNALIKAELDGMLISMSNKGYLDEIDGTIFMTEKGKEYHKNLTGGDEEINT